MPCHETCSSPPADCAALAVMLAPGGCAATCRDQDPGMVGRITTGLSCPTCTTSRFDLGCSTSTPAGGEARHAGLSGAAALPALLAGMNAEQLWPCTNLALPGWLLLIFLPRWRHTPLLTLVAPVIHAVLCEKTHDLQRVLNTPCSTNFLQTNSMLPAFCRRWRRAWRWGRRQ